LAIAGTQSEGWLIKKQMWSHDTMKPNEIAPQSKTLARKKNKDITKPTDEARSWSCHNNFSLLIRTHFPGDDPSLPPGISSKLYLSL